MDVYEELVRLRREGRCAALATIITTQGSIPSFASAKMLVRDDGSVVGTIGGGCVEAQVITAARKVIEQEKPETLEFNLHNNPTFDTGLVCGGTLEVFLEPILPQPVLYIFGAGHVGLYTHKVATLAGFQVVVVDDRASFANRERFPEALDVQCGDWDATLAALTPHDTSFILIVTRGHREDMRVLRWAVTTKARYIGMIGSKRKVVTIYKELQKQGFTADRFDRVHAPVGLDIGATTPEEIAIATVAEMIAFRRHSTAALPSMRYLKVIAEEPQKVAVG
jgi:xanthine dehydrogenase accessory factor